MNFGLRVQDCEGYKTPRFTVVQKAMPKLFGYAPLETWILGLFFFVWTRPYACTVADTRHQTINEALAPYL
jgi:hypothetical protein